MNVMVVNQNGKILYNAGTIPITELQEVYQESEGFNSAYLKYLSSDSDTYFNELQCNKLKQELLRLDQSKCQNIVHLISHAIKVAQKEHGFVKLQPV